MKTKFRYVLFDLGNVVFRVEFDRCFQVWSDRSGIPFAEIKSRFTFDGAYCQHETSQLSAAKYHAHICRLLGASLSFEDFETGWNAIYGEVIPETIAFLEEASQQLNFAAFTNSNSTHREFWSQRYALVLDKFDRVFCSSQIGFRKPNREGFEFILRELELPPDELVFVDDLLENVRAAKSLGMSAVHFFEPAQGILELRNLVFG